jgi:hypothetical protein
VIDAGRPAVPHGEELGVTQTSLTDSRMNFTLAPPGGVSYPADH